MLSICLTIYNKAHLILDVLNGIVKNTIGAYELICNFDGCTDESESIASKFLYENVKDYKILFADNVFETKANNMCLKEASRNYVCIIQDDQIITEKDWDVRILRPFKEFSDVFAVTGRTAHNYYENKNSKFLNSPTNDIGEWSDVVLPCDIADRTNTFRDEFTIRSTVNRGPLCIRHDDLIVMDYLDEIYAPQELCEHDTMYRMHKKLGKVCGFYDIGWWSKPEFGGTRDEKGNTKRWLFEANHKNSKIFLERHREALNNRIMETRVLK